MISRESIDSFVGFLSLSRLQLNLAGNQLTKLSPRLFLTLKDLTELDVSNCDLVEMWSEPMSDILLSKLLRNLKMLNVSNNNIVHARHTHFSTMEHLEVLDLGNNHLHCDEGFHDLIKWLVNRNVSENRAVRVLGFELISSFAILD